MKILLKILLLTFIVSSCAPKVYSHKPTLQETQAIYHEHNNKPLKQKQIKSVIFVSVTAFVFSYVYVSTMKKN